MRSNEFGKRVWKCSAAVLAVFLALSLAGCSGPRARLGYVPTATFGVQYADPENIGPHAYHYSLFEKGGILYTCNGGNLDLDHIRGNADQTRYQVGQWHRILSERRESHSFSLSGEMSTHHIYLMYPKNWDTLENKEEVIDELAFAAGPYFTYSATTWHEILTWFGVHFMLFEPEFNSAFSWEDLYSNLLGIHLSLEAMQTPGSDFDVAMEQALQKALNRLNVVPKKTAIAVSDGIRGKWFTGNVVPDIKMRNFDIGLDGTVTPTLIPNVLGCPDPTPAPLEAPSLNVFKKYGFTILYEIHPNVLEQGSIYKAAGEDRICPFKHFPILLEYMKKEAVQKGYQYQE